MGKAKRLRQLRKNFSKPQMPDCLQGTSSEFLNKQIDLEMMPVLDCRNFGQQLTKHHLILPTSSDQNNARSLFVQHQQQIMCSMTPLIQKHGKGWIVQRHDYRKNYTDWGYIKANRASVKQLSCEVFSGSLGQTVTDVIETALQEWSFEPSNQLIPVIAITNSSEDSSWLYCI